MSPSPDDPDTAGHAVPKRVVALVSGQPVLAELLGAQMQTRGGWKVVVLNREGPDVLVRVCALDPALIVLDFAEEHSPDLTLLSQLRDAMPDVGVLLLGELSTPSLNDALDRGARGSLRYTASISDVCAAADTIASGGTYIPVIDLNRHLATPSSVPESHGPPPLSNRELDVLRRLAAGRSTEVIATELGISVPTVRKHVQHIFTKLGVHSKLAAAAYAARAGIT